MPFSSPIKAIIFDMDGVITDSEPLINAAAVQMFAEFGVTVAPEDFYPFIGTGEDRYIGGVAEQHGCAVDLREAKRRTYEIYLEIAPRQLRAFDGATDLVRACRAGGFRLALASSADRIKIDANLEAIGLGVEAWDAIVSGDAVTHKKPAPDLFLAAAQALGVEPEHCLVIEDAPNGIAAARSAGMRCIAVAQTFAADQLEEADRVVSAIRDLDVKTIAG